MTAVDTNVAIAALVEWHESHDQCVYAARNAAIPAHALIETYSVLTRLPGRNRLDGSLVSDLVTNKFPTERVLVPSPQLQTDILERFIAVGIEGGACYDALIALTAAEHGERLATCDTRAARTYSALGIDYLLIETDPIDGPDA